MAKVSTVQTNFFGGRFSPQMQGRMDSPQYKTALAEMFNAMPSEEGAFIRRSGFEWLDYTLDGNPARLMPFKFSTTDPYLAEFSDANLRIWDNKLLVLTNDPFVLISAADDSTPTNFTCDQEYCLNGTLTLHDGDYVLVYNGYLWGTGTYPMIVGPQVYQLSGIANVSDCQFTCNLVDPITGDAISVGTAVEDIYSFFNKVLVLPAPYSEGQLQAIRKVQFSGDQASVYASAPIEQVVFLHPAVQPQALSTVSPFGQGLQPVKFTDGPYLDQPDVQIPLQPSATSGVINLAVIGWLASTTYALGDAVAYNNLIYISLADNNLGNTPPSTVNQYWVVAPAEWVSGTTYETGQAALYGGVIYFSSGNSNTDNEPDDSPSDWSSAVPPAYASGTSYYETAYVTYDNTTYVSLVNSNMGHEPDTSPSDWAPINIVQVSSEVQELLSGFTFTPGDIGRHIRLQAAPPPWVATQTYALDALVTYNGNIYESLISSNTNNEPDINPTDWQLQSTLPAWTWGIITGGGGQVLIDSIAAWDSSTNYSQYTLVTYNGYVYFADNQSGNGNGSNEDKQPLDCQYTISQADGGSNSLWWICLGAVNDGGLYAPPWVAQVYSYLSVVSYSGTNYVNVHSSVGENCIPGICEYWKALSGGTNTVDQSPYSITVSIQGPNLPNTNPIYSWQLGLYCDATGWPSCGTFHEGRLWLNGPVANRFDASSSNDPFNFSPTEFNGTVDDANAVSETLNAETTEVIYSFASDVRGLTIYTAGGEWLVSASQLDDPITPTSIQARLVSSWGAYNAENVRLPTARCVIHGLQHKVLEHKLFIDTSSYSVLYAANDLTHVAKDLSAPGVVEVAWNREPIQNIWARNTDGSWFGIAYKREPDLVYVGPHKHAHAYGDTLWSFGVQLDNSGVNENLYGCFGTTVEVDGVAETTYNVQWLHDPWIPLQDEPQNAFMLDRGVQATTIGMSAPNYADVSTWKLKFMGLSSLAGQTVSLVIGGVSWGQIDVADDGTAILAVLPGFQYNPDTNAYFGDGPLNPYLLFQAFNWQTYFDTDSLSDVISNLGGPTPSDPSSPTNYAILMIGIYSMVSAYESYDTTDTDFHYKAPLTNAPNWQYTLNTGDFFLTDDYVATCNAIFGVPYLSQGQLLRPLEGGQNGPTFAKIRRSDRMGLLVSYVNEVSIGSDFLTTLHSLPLTLDGTKNVTAPAPGDLVSGVFRDSVDNDYDYDGMLTWQFTEPYPGAVLAAGTFTGVNDI